MKNLRKPNDQKMHRIAKEIANNPKHKDLAKRITEYYRYRGEGYTLESKAYQFLRDSWEYCKAINSRRVYCIIRHVSSSGMSRVMDFGEFRTAKSEYSEGNYCSFYSLFNTLGYNYLRERKGYRIHGCGMDMVFHVNYTIIHDIARLGLINKEICTDLAQKTPIVL